jgi:lysozyme
MRASDKIKEFIKNEEGCKLTAYKPLATDKWTIGYGATYFSPTLPVKEGDTILQEDADNLLNKFVDDVAAGISKTRIPANVTGNQFDAVVSLVYNIGLTAFKTSATGKLFYAGLDISEKFPMWNRSGGNVIIGLTNRRMKERNIYVSNEYPS